MPRKDKPIATEARNLEALRTAARALIERLDNITTEEFRLGGERQEREALRAAILQAEAGALTHYATIRAVPRKANTAEYDKSPRFDSEAEAEAWASSWLLDRKEMDFQTVEITYHTAPALRFGEGTGNPSLLTLSVELDQVSRPLK